MPCYISENVPKTAAITSNVKQFNIANGAKWWAENILKAENNRVFEENEIIDAGFDIGHTIKQLETLYTRNI